MRINFIKLQWFRGAATEVTLETTTKSAVVYGSNGSGKSSFVDAFEYVINKGKIEHLAHEYSGHRQEKGIINTHTPTGSNIFLKFDFNEGKNLSSSIKSNGEFTTTGSASDTIDKWEYMRTILRQNEVADFITGTKGDKYSALLPLLGLHQLEFTAENFRQLARTVERESRINDHNNRILFIKSRRVEKLGEVNDAKVTTYIEALYKKYFPEKVKEGDLFVKCKDTAEALDKQVRGLDGSKKIYTALSEVGRVSLEDDIKDIRDIASKFIDAADPLIQERLTILQAAEIFSTKLVGKTKVSCPACGQDITPEDFKSHVSKEKAKLQEIISIFTLHKTAITKLCDDITKIKNGLDKEELRLWKNNNVSKQHTEKFEWLSKLNIEALRESCTEEVLQQLEVNVLPLVKFVTKSAGDAPDDVSQLLDEKNMVEIAEEMLEAQILSDQIHKSQALIDLLYAIEAGARKEIRECSEKIITDISEDIQRMWEVLHPDKKIENIKLYLPDDIDKAVDIHLKFYGIEQNSPRLTLSEGNRNSLGLCIFLAMAKQDQTDRPLFLDDVIVSLDRDFRGMIADLLIKEFSDKQVFIFTHDRDWFIELKQRLDAASWQFKSLMPWDNPSVGIRLSEKTMGFDDARKDVDTAPDQAGTTVRKIMDIELGSRAEQLKIKLPYLHRERNDHRVAHEFLKSFIEDGEKCFEIKDGNGYKINEEAIAAFREADSLMLAWANRGTHTFDAVKAEANRLIQTCEDALTFFICSGCKQSVGRLEDEKSELKQCQCGNLRWRYGRV